jgi:hypothetical protein
MLLARTNIDIDVKSEGTLVNKITAFWPNYCCLKKAPPNFVIWPKIFEAFCYL